MLKRAIRTDGGPGISRLRYGIAVGFLAFMLAACGQAAQPGSGAPGASAASNSQAAAAVQTINVAFAGAGGSETIPFAMGDSFFQQNGIDVKTSLMLGNTAMPGLSSGDLDFYSDPQPALRAAIQGLPIKVVGGAYPTSGPFLIATPDVKSITDLKGKRVALAVAGGVYELELQAALDKVQMQVGKDVEPIYLPDTPSRLVALSNHTVSAAVVAVPTQFQAGKLGLNVVINFADAVPHLSDGWSTSVKNIQTNPDKVKRFLRAFLQIVDYMRTHKSEVVPVMASKLNMQEDQAAEEYDLDFRDWHNGSLSDDRINLALALLQRDGTIKGELPPISQVADFSLLSAVQKELGLSS
ncbi:MAG TPA: ABC transporter substrate-binding protein [Chloroflexota bacterium]|nr:ABC transporter substrate-binding protein [Chloroflexota bacterium]